MIPQPLEFLACRTELGFCEGHLTFESLVLACFLLVSLFNLGHAGLGKLNRLKTGLELGFMALVHLSHLIQLRSKVLRSLIQLDYNPLLFNQHTR
jgi:hypothetical protein